MKNIITFLMKYDLTVSVIVCYTNEIDFYHYDVWDEYRTSTVNMYALKTTTCTRKSSHDEL
jgi:hypothetical protein